MSLIKGILLGGILTWLIALVLGSNHANTGWLSVHQMAVASYKIYWSWPLFIAASGLSWALIAMMPNNR